jgi:hypothetical protein
MNPQGFRWCHLSTRLAVYARDDWHCLACRVALRWQKGRGKWTDCRAKAASLDHVVPKVLGGSNDPTNLITLCVSCNSSRADALLELWRPDLVDVALVQTSTPIDRALGRALAAELDPAWVARMARPRGQRAANASAPF